MDLNWCNQMKLLVSVINQKEAQDSIESGADIIDVKNPKEGSLGANFPGVIREIKQVIPENLELSATLGDLPNLPGTASLAALGAAVSGVNYVKVGLFGVKNIEQATELMMEVVKAVKDYNPKMKTITCGYADFRSYGCVDPLKLPIIAKNSKADGILVDIKTKNKKLNLFSFFDNKELLKLIKETHEKNLIAALAGSLKVNDISRVYHLGADIIGVRGAVCSSNNRISGKLEKEKVTSFVKEINKF